MGRDPIDKVEKAYDRIEGREAEDLREEGDQDDPHDLGDSDRV